MVLQGSAVGDIVCDRVRLEQVEAVGAAEGGGLAEGEFGEEVWGFVCLAEFEGGVFDLEAVEVCYGVDLRGLDTTYLSETV